MFHSLGHYRPHGFALLVALCLPCLADFSYTDSQNLEEINYMLSSPSGYPFLYTDLSTIVSTVSSTRTDVGTINTRLYDLLRSFESVLVPDIDNGYYEAVNVDFNLSGYYPYVLPGYSYDPRVNVDITVTNVAETYWLKKISSQLDLMAGGGVSMLTPFGYIKDWDYFDYWDRFQTFIEQGDFANAIYNSGLWGLFPMLMLDTIDYSQVSQNDPALLNFLRYQLGMNDVTARRVLRTLLLDGGLGPTLNRQYGNAPILNYFRSSGLDSASFNPTNFFSSTGSIENTDNSFTNSTSVFHNFATSFLPSGMFNPDTVNTDVFDYVECDIDSPSFSPPNLDGNNGVRLSSVSSGFSITNSSGDFKYNLLNPFGEVTDTVQHDTATDAKFESLANLVNQRFQDIFSTPLNNIMVQPARWAAVLVDKDLNKTEDYVDSQYAQVSDGLDFVCWLCESMMFFTFFSFCVRRSLNIQKISESSSAI